MSELEGDLLVEGIDPINMENEPTSEGEMDEVPIVDSLSSPAMRRPSDCSLASFPQLSDDKSVLLQQNIPLVQVRNPEKHGEGFKDAFVSYEVYSQFGQSTYQVRRRYQDFLYLLTRIAVEFEKESVILPAMPDKQRFDYMDRFSPEFIKKRQIGLERFLQRCFQHPKLSQSSELINFLQHQPLRSGKEGGEEVGGRLQSPVEVASSQSTVAAVVEKISDVVLHAFTADRTIEENFKNMKKATCLLEDHLEKIGMLHGKIAKIHQSLSESMLTSSRVLDAISSDFNLLETLITENTPSFSATMDTEVQPPSLRSMSGDWGQVMEEMGSVAMGLGGEIELKIQNYYNELVLYCKSAKQALKDRDQRQFAWQDLEDQVKSLRLEHAQLLGEPLNDPESSLIKSHRSAVVSFFSEKIDSMRGIDPIVSRSDRMKKIEGKIDELEKSLKVTKELSTMTDSALEIEYRAFLEMLCHELQDCLFPDMATVVVEHCQQQLHIWQTFTTDLSPK